jgi:hypothetical protein
VLPRNNLGGPVSRLATSVGRKFDAKPKRGEGQDYDPEQALDAFQEWRPIERGSRSRHGVVWFRGEALLASNRGILQPRHSTFPFFISPARYSLARTESAEIVIVGFRHPQVADAALSTTNNKFLIS